METAPETQWPRRAWTRRAGWLAAAVCVCGAAWFLRLGFRGAVGTDPEPERLALGPAGDAATAAVYLPRKPDGAAIVICPGGGYGTLVLEAEGHRVARWLNRNGIVGVVLEYRFPQGDPNRPLADAQEAIRLVRRQAAAWGVRTNQIGILGFSAGGHLAAMAATMPDLAAPDERDGAARPSSRPDFAVLVYPVISMDELADAGSRLGLLGPHPAPERIAAYSTDRRVTAATPPVFLVHARDDAVVSAENSRRFLAALQARGISGAYLELDSGGHGLGYGGPLWDKWQTQALAWLRSQDLVAPGSGGE